jgi:hypothetical protein
LGEFRLEAHHGAPGRCTDRTGVTVFLKEIITPMRKWMESRFTDVQHWSDTPKGGHFGAFEQPELLVRDVRTFFRPLRQS